MRVQMELIVGRRSHVAFLAATVLGTFLNCSNENSIKLCQFSNESKDKAAALKSRLVTAESEN